MGRSGRQRYIQVAVCSLNHINDMRSCEMWPGAVSWDGCHGFNAR